MSHRGSMRIHPAIAAALVVLLCSHAAPATGPARVEPELLASLRWQIALERSAFSPGIIDGVPGRKTALATMQFQRHSGLRATGRVDAETAEALGLSTIDPLATCTIGQSEAALVTGKTPAGWVAKSKVALLGYESLADVVAEKHHCSRALLARLNRGIDLNRLKVGDSLTVPAIDDSYAPRAQRLAIDMAEKVIRAYGADGRVIALFHCSIARDASQRPRGQARIITIVMDPDYHFDPKGWPEVKDVHQKLRIPPGPRNPVGKCWIGLSLSGYGIHGTPNPELIGKTGSHGCVRLTNWDALRLARMVRVGTAVEFLTE